VNLHHHTKDALHYKTDVARDTYDPRDEDSAEWQAVATGCATVASAGTTEALRVTPLALRELEDYLGGEMSPAERRAIQADLCRAGWYERHDPATVSTRRPRTLRVDGVRYEVA
jgi:hypothetical protein